MASTPLVEAVKKDDLAEVARRLDAGDDINAKDQSGDTALHWAAWNGNARIVKLLVARGADVSLTNSSGEWLDCTAAMLAERMKHLEILPLLDAPPAPKVSLTAGEKWVEMGPHSIALDGAYPALGKRLTYVFNFESRERVLLTENLRTKGEAVSQPTPFDDLPQSLVEKAYDAFTSRGGQADRDFVMNGAQPLGKTRHEPQLK